MLKNIQLFYQYSLAVAWPHLDNWLLDSWKSGLRQLSSFSSNRLGILLVGLAVSWLAGCTSLTTSVAQPVPNNLAPASSPSLNQSFVTPNTASQSLGAADFTGAKLSSAASLNTVTAWSADSNRGLNALNGELVLYLLSAELAGQRNDLSAAVEIYASLLHQTQHPAVAERTTWIAQFAEQPEVAALAAVTWAELQPDKALAQRTAAGMLWHNRKYVAALDYLLRYENLGGVGNYTLLVRHLLASLDVDAPATAIPDLAGADLTGTAQQELLNVYTVLKDEQQLPTSLLANPEKLTAAQRASVADRFTALALLAQALGANTISAEHLATALAADPGFITAVQLQARLLIADDAFAPAEKILHQALLRQEDAVELWLELARVYLYTGRLVAAEETFAHILLLQPDNLAIYLALARLQLETGQEAAAKDKLLLVAQEASQADLAHQAYWHLGQLAAKEGQPELALEYYAQITQGELLLQAVQARAYLLHEQQATTAALAWLEEARYDYPELITPLTLLGEFFLRQEGEFALALDWLNSGLQLMPEEEPAIHLLYTRALTYFYLGDLAQMEQDLQFVLAQEPNNVAALNALGYTLIDQPERLHEGFLLIKKAHALDSEAPEILDSLGWALFKLGRWEEALEYLRQAYAQLPDQEIAEHLLEVLLQLNLEQEAAEILLKFPMLQP